MFYTLLSNSQLFQNLKNGPNLSKSKIKSSYEEMFIKEEDDFVKEISSHE